jgi:hypothetical protein
VAGTILPLDAVQMSSASSRTRSSLGHTIASAQLPSARSRQHPWSPWKRLPAIVGLRQTGSRMSPPWAAIAQITKMSRVMRSSAQNG